MENREFKISKSASFEKHETAEIEAEVKARIAEIREGRCVIGEGKTAEVFVCERDPWVCYKIINSNQFFRIDVEQEMKFMDMCQKLNIRVPKPVFCIKSSDFEVLVMERIEGDTVEEVISENGDPGEKFDFDDFFTELGQFIKILHANRIYHRDLHGGNIMIDGQGKPWIIDFGSASTAFNEEEAYVSKAINSMSKKYETIRFIHDEIQLSKARNGLRQSLLGKAKNT